METRRKFGLGARLAVLAPSHWGSDNGREQEAAFRVQRRAVAASSVAGCSAVTMDLGRLRRS
jgi:hypothetical protein